jgi:Tetracyclin repressor-like, C-terminal domain
MARLIGKWLGPVIDAPGADRPDLRASLIASHLMGLATLYYLAPMPPLAGLPARLLAAVVAPGLQRLLTGEV